MENNKRENRKAEKELDLDQLDKVAGGERPRPDNQKTYICNKCGAVFTNQNAFNCHMLDKHGVQLFPGF